MAKFKSGLKLDQMVESVTNQSLVQLTQAVQKVWTETAKKKLNTTYPDYAKAITTKISLGTSSSAEIFLKGDWANKLEVGFPSYDMKPLLKNSKSAKKSLEDTWYATIPFEFRTPNATGRTGAVMSNSIYRSARALPSWGKLTSKGTDKSLGIYEGLVKVPTTGNKHSYKNFRTVSENSPKEAFIHPGFEGVHIQEELSAQIPDTFQKLVSENIKYFK